MNLKIIESLRDGSLVGEPRLIQRSFGYSAQCENHRLKAEHWGGSLQDVGIYCINACRYFFDDEPIEVMAVETKSEDDPRFSEVVASYAMRSLLNSPRVA